VDQAYGVSFTQSMDSGHGSIKLIKLRPSTGGWTAKIRRTKGYVPDLI
jgi:hypothetical protein